jgi:DNA ligase-1
MLFRDYAQYLEKLESISSRNEMVELLAELLQQLSAVEIAAALYMMQGRVVPAYEALELNFANKSFVNILQSMDGEQSIKKLFDRLGDSGEVAAELGPDFFAKLKTTGEMFAEEELPVNPSVSDVHKALFKIANVSGKGSVEQKSEIVKSVLVKLETEQEFKYFARIVTGKLRLGLSTKTILDAISWAKHGDKSLKSDLERAYGLRADIGDLATEVLHNNLDPKDIKLKVGVPMAAQLVERAKSAVEVLERMKEAIVQPKYDGLRAQLHYKKAGFDDGVDGAAATKVKIFSRNLEPLTDMFPDLVQFFEEQIHLEDLILDGEVIGYDQSTSTFLPFQETIKRKRKYDVAEKSGEIPIKYFAFDMLCLNGEDLTLTPLEERLAKLKQLELKDGKLSMMVAKTESPVYTSADELDKYFRSLLDAGLEGIIAKSPVSTYQPGKRGFDWIKLKANTHSDLMDTVDCLIMGYLYGEGNRARFGIGGFLVGTYNAESGKFLSLAKIGSGVKEEEWPKFKQMLDEFATDTKPALYEFGGVKPDIMIKPEFVIEVDADEISESKNHAAGYSLRFPRLKRFRPEKAPEQITSLQEIVNMYKHK